MSSPHALSDPGRSPWRRGLLLLAAAAAAGGTAPVAAQSSPYYIAGSVALTQDSNLQRLADDQPTPDGASRSDTSYSTALIGGINQGIGRQRVYGSLTLRDNRFERNKRFDNQSYNGALGLDWATVERVSGTLSLSAVRALSPFNADGVGLLSEKNLETTQSANALVRVGLVTAYSLELSGGMRRVRNSLDKDVLRARNFNQDNLSVGVGWRPGGALAISVAVREVNGEYPNFRGDAASGFESDRFKQQFFDLVSTWQPTGASVVDLRLNFADTKYVVNEQRNFSAVNGSLGWQWQPTGKLRLNTRYSRDRGQDAYPSTKLVLIRGFPFPIPIPVTNFDSRIVDSLRAQAELEVSAKVALTSSLQLTRRALTRDPLAVADKSSQGITNAHDSTTQFNIGARWALTRAVLLGCDVGNERRTFSGDRELSFNLKDTTLSCFGQLTLQ